MKISFTCNNIGTGGAERVICNLANKMGEEGYSVQITCYEKLPSFYYELHPNVSINELDPDINNRNSFVKRKTAGFINFVRLYKALKDSDRVVSFYTRQNCYSILVCKLLNIPIICAERDHFFMYDSKVNHIMRRLFYPMADGFIHQTNMVRDYLRKNEGVKSVDVVIPNPLWMKTFPDRTPQEGRIIAVGRLAEQKNYEGMLRAFSYIAKRNQNCSLHIYGSGDAMTLREYANGLGVGDLVFFEGNSENITECYKNAEVFIMSSHGEGYPNALMEALAMGVPSVSYDCPAGGPSDMIQDGINGFLVNHEDEKMLADRVCQLLDDSDLRERFSQNAISIRKDNFFDTIYKRYMDFILSCHKPITKKSEK